MANTQSKRMYCPSCGQDVETFIMLQDGDERHFCFLCSSPLSETPSHEPMKPMDTILIADDSAVFREVLKDKLAEKKVARNVMVSGNGEEFLTLFTNRLYKKEPVSFVILDIRMPVFNGVNAAMAMRGVEKGFEAKRRVPILFFSTVVCDDTLREVLKYCAPARYINKGSSSSPDELAQRLYEVIRRLIQESARK
jgi:DNA-binding NarL/FixJ family response regulator